MYNHKIIKNDLIKIISENIQFEKLKKKSVLVTGATGMLASYFIYTLMYLNDTLDYNIKIYALARNEKKLEQMTDLKRRTDIVPIIQDVCHPIVVNEPVDYIIHMASSANPSSIISNPVGIIEANVLGTLNVLKLANMKNAQILFTSTREIYGSMDSSKTSIDENDMGILYPSEVRSCYPESKKMGENLIISYAYQHKIEYNIVRIAHSYGPEMIINNDGRIMSDLLSNVINNEDIVLKSTGEALRAFCYVSDATAAMFCILLNNRKNEIYNLANETEEISIKDLANLILNISNNPNINVIFNIPKQQGIGYVNFKRVKLNTNKIEELGWKPKTTLEQGIKQTLEYFSRNSME